jgi:hypothetical protein
MDYNNDEARHQTGYGHSLGYQTGVSEEDGHHASEGDHPEWAWAIGGEPRKLRVDFDRFSVHLGGKGSEVQTHKAPFGTWGLRVG